MQGVCELWRTEIRPCNQQRDMSFHGGSAGMICPLLGLCLQAEFDLAMSSMGIAGLRMMGAGVRLFRLATIRSCFV